MKIKKKNKKNDVEENYEIKGVEGVGGGFRRCFFFLQKKVKESSSPPGGCRAGDLYNNKKVRERERDREGAGDDTIYDT